jgi:hypothetical protein
MSSLLFFSPDDFVIDKGQKGSVLRTKISGISVILFYSNGCEYCPNLKRLFHQIAGSISGCQFGLMNLSLHKQFIYSTQGTTTPLVYVPFIVLYVNGKPYLEYKGPHDLQSITNFVVEVANNMHQKQSFTSNNNKNIQRQSSNKIPQYSLGKPIRGENRVCYLEMDTAYVNIKK